MNETYEHIVNIFKAKSEHQVCNLIQHAIINLKLNNYFDEVPEFYQNMEVQYAKDIEMYFNEMKQDNFNEEFEEGKMKELFGLFDAAVQRLSELR